MEQDTSDSTKNPLNTPNCQRTTSSIYRLIHFSNGSNVSEISDESHGGSPVNAKMNGQAPHPNQMYNSNAVPYLHNSTHANNVENANYKASRPILPSLANANSGRSLSQTHSNLQSSTPFLERTQSNNSTFPGNNATGGLSNLEQQQYLQSNGIGGSQSSMGSFKNGHITADITKGAGLYSFSNQMHPHEYQRTSAKVESHDGSPIILPHGHITGSLPAHTVNSDIGQYNYLDSGSQTPSDTASPTEYPYKPHIKTKMSNNLLASRRNTQELIAKTIAEKHVDKPISEYALVVREAELEVLNMNPQTNSKSAFQALEQKKERERQVFALLWLMKNCEAQHDSYVPRGKIFAQYASSCAQNSLKPLSQASLGKLIRTVFPGLTTRRLGMRGQSKYHYCGLKLSNFDDNDDSDDDSIVETSKNNIQSNQENEKSTESNDSIVISEDHHKEYDDGDEKEDNEINIAKHELEIEYEDEMTNETQYKKIKVEPKEISDIKTNINDNESITFKDIFSDIFNNEVIMSSNFKINLPPIPKDKLSKTIDEDIISSLESLYHIHCNKIFENIKFFKLEKLSSDLLLFHSGSVSPQMYNLFISEELYDWINECDQITYNSITRALSKLVINKNGPEPDIIRKLENFIETYSKQVSKCSIDLPVPLRSSKTLYAKRFTELIKKLIKLEKFIMNFLNSFETFQEGMKTDWDNIKLDYIYEMVSTDKYHEMIKGIKVFLLKTIPILFSNKEDKNAEFMKLIVKFLEFISGKLEWSANTVINSYARFTNALIGDISLKSSENLLPWLFFNNVTVQLLNYSFEAKKFVSN